MKKDRVRAFGLFFAAKSCIFVTDTKKVLTNSYKNTYEVFTTNRS